MVMMNASGVEGGLEFRGMWTNSRQSIRSPDNLSK